MFGTTKLFLDYFGLKKLDDLPPLADLSDWESLRVQLDLPEVSEDSHEDLPEAEPTADIPHLVVALDDDSDDSGESALEEDEGDPYPEEPEVHVDLPELEPVIDEETGEVKAIRTIEPASAELLERDEEKRPDLDSADADEEAAATDPDEAGPVADDELVVSEWPDPVESGRG
jgi:segregation and condensation protein B